MNDLIKNINYINYSFILYFCLDRDITKNNGCNVKKEKEKKTIASVTMLE